VYRFGAALTLSVILPRRGWTLIKQTKTYTYLSPPPNTPRPFRIRVAVPSPEEVLGIARRAYDAGESWMGQLGEWPAWYFHERDRNIQRMWRDPATDEMRSERLARPPQSTLSIGEWGVWQAQATAEGGDFVLGVLPRSAMPRLDAVAQSAEADREPLWEGGTQSVELTIHERNREARRQCIAHFGPTCQACGLNYDEVYGPMGAGLVHVHHITPLAEIGERYVVDPLVDLVPLCATCHHVVHSRNPAFAVAEIKAALSQARRVREDVA
jgi:5-methylcytosine-specific restriction protein A